MKRLLAFLLAALLLTAGAAAQATPLRVGALKGPTAMGLVKLMADSEGGDDYAFSLYASPDALLPELMKGQLDLACIPVSLAAVLYRNTKGALKAVGINILGVLYVLENGETVNSLQDLAGRRLYASGKASTPEYVLSHLLQQAGVEGVEVVWKAEHAEALAALLVDPEGLAMLPQPFVTLALAKNPALRVALDLNRAWEDLGRGRLITGVTVARGEVLDARREDVRRFLDAYAASAAFANGNVKEAAALVGRYGILDAGPAEKALPFCGITLVTGDEMKAELETFYAMLFAQNPDAVGGAAPDDAFYFVP
jgi:NitT/TauT family transport system substrate-binding protein